MPALTARDTARRLIASESAHPGAPLDDVAAAERALQRLAGELTGWFGPFGTHALFTRALAHARVGHPALADVTVGTPSAPQVAGLADRVRAHGAAGVVGVEELLAWIIELLGRLIGDELASAMIKQGVRNGVALPPAVGAADGGAVGDDTGLTGDTTGSTTDD